MAQNKIRSTLNTFFELCDKLEDNGLFTPMQDHHLRDYARLEFLKYLMHLTDGGRVNVNEMYFINENLDYDFNTKALKNLYETMIEGKDYGKVIPETLKLLVKNDKKSGSSTAKLLVDLYRNLGICYSACDNVAGEDQVYKLTEYVLLLQNFIEDDLPKAQTSGGKVIDEFAVDLTETDPVEEPEKTTEDLLAELNELVGLENVKKDVNSLVNLIKIRNLRKERGIKEIEMSLHMVFSGNPGTGKTTVARLLSEIYRSIGLLSKGHLVETDRSGLVAGYVGQTAIKTKEVINSALGGVLFIDEAYALTENRGENDFGGEAIDTLLKAMEDERDDFIVIVAGYPDLMDGFVCSNPGLRSRFNKYIYFPDYTAEELLEMLKSRCDKGDYILSSEAEEFAREYFINRVENKPENYANGRDVRNFFEKAAVNQADRLAGLIGGEITDEVLKTLEKSDLENIEI